MTETGRKRRYRMLLVLFFAVMLVFIGRLFLLQVVHGQDYLAQSMRNLLKTQKVEAVRGEIVDRNGALLVGNAVSYTVTLDLHEMGASKEETILALLELCRELGLSWTDTLPVSPAAPYGYTLEGASPPARARFEDYLARLDIDAPQKAGDLLALLGEEYGLTPQLPPQTRRQVVGVLYECALRTKEITYSPYLFLEGAEIDFITRVKERGLPGIILTPSAKRQYETAAAAHILGRVGQMDEGEWAAYGPLGYAMDARIGKDGIEQVFEAQLHGVPGVRTQERDKEGRVVGETYETLPKPGDQVCLTLDLALQEQAEVVLAEAMGSLPQAQGAAFALLDVRDGGVLALGSYPSFSLASFSADYTALDADPKKPLLNRALQGTYAPGSTFKMVTAAASLEEGIITPETQILDTGRYRYYKSPQPLCWLTRQEGRTHGLENVTEAIADSCNVFFYDVGRRLGIEKLEEYARRFGLGEKTGIELPGEEKGVVAGPAYTKSLGQTWYEGSVLSAAIGQENNRFTPLQLAAFTATLASDGTRLETHLLKEIRSHDGETLLKTYSPRTLDTLSLAPESWDAVKAGMLAVTTEGSVAPYFADLRAAGILVGAKTGSAQVSKEDEANAVFVCFAPYENPQVALAIVVEKGGAGSELGGVASQILECYFGVNQPGQGGE